MDPANNTAAAVPPQGEAESIMEWGEGRRAEARIAMTTVLGRIGKERFSGCRTKPGQVALEFDDPVTAGAHYTGELLQYVQDLGAELVLAPDPQPLEGDAQTYPHAADGLLPFAPWETVLITGTIPLATAEHRGKGVGQIMEACVEVLRVLLATAITAAGEECAEGERIVVRLKVRPEVGGKVNIANGRMVGLARISCIIYTSNEPRVSYLLGTAYGEPKARTLAWDFPMVDQIYGPDRLRWRDLRAPDFEPGPDAPKVLAS